jgi:hypothetical protein
MALSKNQNVLPSRMKEIEYLKRVKKQIRYAEIGKEDV